VVVGVTGVVVVVVGLRRVSVAVGAVLPLRGPVAITWAGGDAVTDGGGVEPVT